MSIRRLSASAGLALATIATLGFAFGTSGVSGATIREPRVLVLEADELSAAAEPRPAAAHEAAHAAAHATARTTAPDAAGVPPLPVIAAITNQRIHDPALFPALARDILPSVAVIGPRVLVVWYVRGTIGTQRVHAAYSEDSRETYQDGGWLPNLPGDWRWNFDPSVEADPLTGKFFIASQAIDPAGNQMGVAFVSAEIPGGAGIVWGAPTLPIQTAPFTGSIYINHVHLKFDVTYRSLHLVYRDQFAAAGPLLYRSSTDGGVNWSVPETILSDATHLLGSHPRVGISLQGPLVTYFDYAGWDQVTMRSTRRLDPPGAWQPPVAVSAHRVDLSSVPGTPLDYHFGGALAVDRTLGLYQNRIYAAWIESADFPTWPQPNGDVLLESEPNNTPGEATPTPASAGYVEGYFSPLNEADWYALTLAQGQHLVVRPTALVPYTAQASVTVEFYAADGVHGFGLAGYQADDIGSARTQITAPVAGTYYLRVSGFEMESYALSLAYSSDFTFPRDRRELYTAYSTDLGASWSTPVPIYAGGIGYDVHAPALAVGNDGRPYLCWHDFSVGSANGTVSATRASRSPDGGASWDAPVTLATAVSDWQSLLPNATSLKIGWWIGAATTQPNLFDEANLPGESGESAESGGRTAGTAPGGPSTDAITPEEWMHVMWTDARDGEANIYGMRFPTGFEVIHRTTDTTAVPGQWVGLRLVVENHNTLFTQPMDAYPHVIQRNWPVINQSFFVLPGQRWVGYPIVVQVPDTAAAGSVFVQSGWALGPGAVGMHTFIHVQGSAVGVEPSGPVAAAGLEFAAPSPNPARAQTTFRVSLAIDSDATLAVFDVRGTRVRTLMSGRSAAGAATRTWDLTDEAGRRVAPGLYFAKAEAGGWTRIRRVAVID